MSDCTGFDCRSHLPSWNLAINTHPELTFQNEAVSSAAVILGIQICTKVGEEIPATRVATLGSTPIPLSLDVEGACRLDHLISKPVQQFELLPLLFCVHCDPLRDSTDDSGANDGDSKRPRRGDANVIPEALTADEHASAITGNASPRRHGRNCVSC